MLLTVRVVRDPFHKHDTGWLSARIFVHLVDLDEPIQIDVDSCMTICEPSAHLRTSSSRGRTFHKSRDRVMGEVLEAPRVVCRNFERSAPREFVAGVGGCACPGGHDEVKTCRVVWQDQDRDRLTSVDVIAADWVDAVPSLVLLERRDLSSKSMK